MPLLLIWLYATPEVPAMLLLLVLPNTLNANTLNHSMCLLKLNFIAIPSWCGMCSGGQQAASWRKSIAAYF
jgi:hypothetical protein